MINAKDEDWLSELPDSLIIHILGFLPTTDVVQTTILSKRWKNLWTTIPCLDFVESAMSCKAKFQNFVDGAVNSWMGIKILRFHVQFNRGTNNYGYDNAYDLLTNSVIDSWVHFAVEKKVEEFELCLPFIRRRILVPQCLYSCSSLKKLRLKNCDLQIYGNVHWDQLTSLEIANKDPCEDAVNKVFLGSPKLESSRIALLKSKESLFIRSNSLKSLHIGLFLQPISMDDTEMRIWTPNLKSFFIHGAPCMKKLSLQIDVASLTEAGLLISNRCPSTNEYDRVVEVLTQLLPTIKHVERVTLSDSCIKVLGAVKEKHMLSPFPKADFLELRVDHRDQFEQIARAVEMFPKLRRLDLELICKYPPRSEEFPKFDLRNYFKEKEGERENVPSCFMLQLTRVDVTWTRGNDDGVFELIHFFLEYALNLEKMVLMGTGIEPPSQAESLFMESLMLRRRGDFSKTPQFIFC